MDNVRFGIVGLGNMGSFHVETFSNVRGATLSAICDASPKNLEAAAKKTQARRFEKYQEMLASGEIDAVLIATPHFLHPEIAMAAFDRGVHVLCEKPLAVTVKQGRQVIEAASKHPELKFGMMFQMRTNGLYRKLRELIAEGELGPIGRLTWIATDWFRTWTYYASGGWRATWSGEGGGVIINQCPHNLDLIQWLTGLTPERVTAVGSVGKTHPIEVEDEVSAVIEFGGGAVGHFVTTTGEAPGTNRLEIAGDRGRIVAEHGRLHFRRTRKSVREVRERSPQSFAHVEVWDCEIPYASGGGDEHKQVTQNFVNAIRKDTPMLAPGVEGVRGLEIGNAMLMAGITRKAVELPVDGEAYDAFLKELTQKYGGRKALTTHATTVTDMNASFAKA